MEAPGRQVVGKALNRGSQGGQPGRTGGRREQLDKAWGQRVPAVTPGRHPTGTGELAPGPSPAACLALCSGHCQARPRISFPLHVASRGVSAANPQKPLSRRRPSPLPANSSGSTGQRQGLSRSHRTKHRNRTLAPSLGPRGSRPSRTCGTLAKLALSSRGRPGADDKGTGLQEGAQKARDRAESQGRALVSPVCRAL